MTDAHGALAMGADGERTERPTTGDLAASLISGYIKARVLVLAYKREPPAGWHLPGANRATGSEARCP